MKDGHFALLYYNNGHTDKVGYVGRLVVWITVGKLNEENLIRYFESHAQSICLIEAFKNEHVQNFYCVLNRIKLERPLCKSNWNNLCSGQF